MLPLVFSFVALCVSFIALWKGHLAPFSPLALAGNLGHRVYPIRNENESWYISSFDIPFSITNAGARPGFVTGLRLRLHYKDVLPTDNYELIAAKWELKPDKVHLIDKERFSWIEDVVASDWSPFAVLPKTTSTKHLLFEATWHKPVAPGRIMATLELQSNWKARWLAVAKWQLVLSPSIWVDMENGSSMGYFPAKSQIPTISECSPPDLHNHTGPKTALPSAGILTGAKPSYLNYPESKKD